MNKGTIILVLSLLVMCLSCGQEEMSYTTSATIRLVNETSVDVKSNVFNYVIKPGETLIHKESHTNEYGEKPNVNTYDPFATEGPLFFYNETNSPCQSGLRTLGNYEDKKEISDLNFELTFRFTEAKKAKAEPCGL